MSDLRALPFNDAQYLSSAIVGLVASSFSIFGSFSILYLILRRGMGKLKDQPYYRYVFGMSVGDLLGSWGFFFQPITFPAETTVPMASGNLQTCQATAFMTSFLGASYVYGASLSVYFLLTIRYGRKEKGSLGGFEACVHLGALIVSVVIGATALATDNLNPVRIGICFIAPYPNDCMENPAVDCERGGTGALDLLIAAMAIGIVTSLIGIVCTWMVVWTVNKRIAASRRHSFPSTYDEAQQKRQRAVAIQAVFYTLAYINSFVGMILVLILQLQESFPLLMLSKLILPLQGVFNFLTFVRPQIVKWKENNPNKSFFWAYVQVFTTDSGLSVGRRSRSRSSSHRFGSPSSGDASAGVAVPPSDLAV